ncbi:hypothetical protein EDB85DRAFT_1936257 [Lactarius pseudohatsudake]|nr:hypothetical protein EDB85DRAFT_1936257 [Lactarius pseudohatsudake]
MIVVKPPSPITDYLTCFSGIPAAALDPVIMTLSDVQTHLHALVNSSIILLGRLPESDLHGLQLSYLRCIGIAILFYHPRGRPLKPGLTRELLGRNIQDHGCGGHNPEEDSCASACIDLLKVEIENRPRFGGFWADYEPIIARIAQSRVKWARTVIFYLGSLGAWDGTSATAPAMTVACANNAEVLNRLLGAPSCHELVFGRLMGLADALGFDSS